MQKELHVSNPSKLTSNALILGLNDSAEALVRRLSK